MKNWKMRLLTLLTVVAGLLAVMGPVATADDLRDHRSFDRHDRNNNDNEFFFPVVFSFFAFDNELADCPFAGDFEGVVNQNDCFDNGDFDFDRNDGVNFFIGQED